MSQLDMFGYPCSVCVSRETYIDDRETDNVSRETYIVDRETVYGEFIG